MSAVHLLVETGRASRVAACDEPFANGEPGSEVLADVTCESCRAMFMFRALRAAPVVGVAGSVRGSRTMDP